jgi:ABC-type glutathione transport system ATPase component
MGHDRLFSENTKVGGCTDAVSPAALQVENLGVETPAGVLLLRSLTFALPPHGLTALIGPEAAGKTVLLRALLRLSDQVDGLRLHGRVYLHGQPILAPATGKPYDVNWLGCPAFPDCCRPHFTTI